MEWTDEIIARLRALWDEGHSTAEIGRRLGVSKNAVVGKAHRLTLPPRPSPIRRDASEPARVTNPRRITGSTLPPLPASTPAFGPEPPPAIEPPPPQQHAVAAETRPVPPRSEPVRRPVAAVSSARPTLVAAPRARNVAACCWPIGEPGTRSFRFCDAEAQSNKPYCTEHAQLAYVKVRDRREEAA